MQLFNYDLSVLLIALLSGGVPTLAWLWFWLRQDKEHPEPKGLLAVTFVAGAAAVLLVIPLQLYTVPEALGETTKTFIYAGYEELLKFLGVLFLAFSTGYADEPMDMVIYPVTAALGFAALENSLFLASPIAAGETTTALLTGNLRFLGATVVHALSSALMGIWLALNFKKGFLITIINAVLGLITATILHGLFNYFIISLGEESIITVLAFLWIIGILTMVLVEKVRRYSLQFSSHLS